MQFKECCFCQRMISKEATECRHCNKPQMSTYNNEENELKLILVDPKNEICKAFEKAFAHLPNVRIVTGSFVTISQFDCIISAGNGFGLMDAGIDLAIVKYFGTKVMENIQKYILEEYQGEQPVGTSFIIETKHRTHPFIAHTPTMRIPMCIAHTDNVYLAMRAALLAVRKHNKMENQKIKTLVCSGLGTGSGGMEFEEAAFQMALAYKYFLNPPKWINGSMAQKRHESIWYGGDWGFKKRRPR